MRGAPIASATATLPAGCARCGASTPHRRSGFGCAQASRSRRARALTSDKTCAKRRAPARARQARTGPGPRATPDAARARIASDAAPARAYGQA